ncbi:MAG TPA: ribonuclease P protein component [Candidatus Paceibacterota bacterium]
MAGRLKVVSLEGPHLEGIRRLGKRFQSPHLSLGVLKTQDHGIRVSFIISAKISPRAHQRNLLKRRGRHIIRICAPYMTGGARLAFFFKRGAGSLSFEELKENVEALLREAMLLPRGFSLPA